MEGSSAYASDTCHVVAGPFALGVQAFLAFTVLATLLYKRSQESPRRSWTIWFMDSSKQGFAMALQHLVNLLLAVFFAHDNMKSGECIWYIANFLITVVCGLFILTAYMRLHRHLVQQYDLRILRSGEYGNPPQWTTWAAQMLLWSFVCCAEKFITAGCVIFPLRHAIDYVIGFIEQPMVHSPKLELVLVMVVLPALLNAIFAWIIDNLIKDPELKHHGHAAPSVIEFTDDAPSVESIQKSV